MHSTTEKPPLPDRDAVRAIVPTDDPHIIEVAQRLMAMDDDSLVEIKGVAQSFIAKKRREIEEILKEDTLIDILSANILLKRMTDAGAKALAHDRYTVALTATKTVNKRIDVLRKLEGKVPDAELAPALYLDQPEPQWKGDAAKLRALQRKYGANSEIGRIIEEGLVDVYGAPKLVFEPREPMQIAEAR